MKYTLVILTFLLFHSCDYFETKKTSSEALLNEELKTFSWNELDVYPTFSVCDTVASKIEKKQCFENTITEHLTDYLSNQNLVVSQDISDVLELTFNISDQGKASIVAIKVKDETISELPDIKAILLNSIASLPQIFPAQKRGQQVTSQFKLPVVIEMH